MATAKKTTRKSTTKKDLEAKIADLEAKLNKLAASEPDSFTVFANLICSLMYSCFGQGQFFPPGCL